MQAKDIRVGEVYEVTRNVGRRYRGASYKATCTGKATWPDRWGRYKNEVWKNRTVFCSDNETSGFKFTYTPTSGPNKGVETIIFASGRHVYRTWAEREASEARVVEFNRQEDIRRAEAWRSFDIDAQIIRSVLGAEIDKWVDGTPRPDSYRAANFPPTKITFARSELRDLCHQVAKNSTLNA